ncbi:acetyl-CoA synthetase [Jannaschia pagri]|uniref:Acetyl-CoA synthetase n=1 Tax=Jannaschia pagri TaxID=2829797 RepID=A0ABQ4NHV8_9RHOB|nr:MULTISPECIES: class I adenylate-forming enzyme family protein [unclassified Jannaschia]GIT93999.1 acetyl-CoA synthetase [Jannaschia sp. AI_62]
MTFNLSSYVLAAGRSTPEHLALIIPGEARLTHGEVLKAVSLRAGALRTRGLAPGARILLRLGNDPDFPITFLAACAAGYVPVPTSTQLTVPEITAMAARVDPSLVVAHDGISLPQGYGCVHPDDLAGPSLPFEAWSDGDPNRLGYIVFTSGSGGVPKAVAHAHRAVRARASMHQGWYDLRPEDRMLHAGAFNWTYTLGTGLLDPWTLGATAIVPAAGTTADALPQILATSEATIFAAAPGVYRRMLRADWPDTPALRHGLSAGERLPRATRDRWRQTTGTDLHEALGMSECSTFISGSPSRPAPEGSSGYPQAGRRISTEEGRLRVATDDPGLMLGYWQEGAPQPPEGAWFDTGDRVRQLPDGAIVHEGRADDILNPGGYRVSPQEVEEALADLPVSEIAVGCVEVSGGATVLAAYYVGAELDTQQAEAHAAARLARYKQPRLWLRRDALPRNANGKLIRKALA